MECAECYPDQPKSWRELPMNEIIRAKLQPQRCANIYHHSLYEALKVWGQEIESDTDL